MFETLVLHKFLTKSYYYYYYEVNGHKNARCYFCIFAFIFFRKLILYNVILSMQIGRNTFLSLKA